MPSHYKHETHGPDFLDKEKEQEKKQERKKKKKRKYSTNKSTDDFMRQLEASGEW